MLKLLALFCFALLPLAASAQIEKYAAVCDTGICFHWWPKVPPIAGWHHDQAQSIDLGANVWVPDGSSFADAEGIIYARAIYRPGRPELDSLEKLIDNDQRYFLEHGPALTVSKNQALRTVDGRTLASFAFVPRKEGNWEHVTYAEEGDYYLIFTLSARDKASYERLMPLYTSWMEHYREKP